jgi:hypothetical protein
MTRPETQPERAGGEMTTVPMPCPRCFELSIDAHLLTKDVFNTKADRWSYRCLPCTVGGLDQFWIVPA